LNPGRERYLLEASVISTVTVLPFDESAGLIWARLMSEGTAAGRPRSALDMIVAAIAEANDCIVASDNEKDLGGLKNHRSLAHCEKTGSTGRTTKPF
jgi:predicted nucleic acid-binding protein